jgi:hypothetical protein
MYVMRRWTSIEHSIHAHAWTVSFALLGLFLPLLLM